MKIALVTGRRAEKMVKEAVDNAPLDNIICDIITQDIEIAAFSTPKSLKRSLERRNFPSYDIILVSGLCSADFSELEKEIATPIRLGPKHAYDLIDVLPLIGKVELSSRIPADEIIRVERRKRAEELIREVEGKIEGRFKIKGVKIGGGTRMKVCAEIVDATRLREDEIHKKIQYFLDSGADIIDIGVSLEAKEKEVKEAVKIALSYDVPVSVDTMEPNLILAAIDAGVDMVLSLDSDIIENIGEEVANADVAAVIIPDFGRKKEEREGSLQSLFDNLKKASEVGIKKIIADPLLNSVGYGLAASLHDYYDFRVRDRETPLFFGIGNVTELIDGDSIGINAVLAGIA
ncbi:MAG: dihydropteroate synthase, partial [Candidatus Methanospirareceae archaeon]